MEEISFGTAGWRATLDVFTDERVRAVGRAVAAYLRDTTGAGSGPVVVGYDARESSPGFAASLAEVLAADGFDVVLPERDCPTPVVSFTIVDRGLPGGLVVTASHNPPEYNGVKFIPPDGAPAPTDVTMAIEARIREPPDPVPPTSSRDGRVVRSDLLGAYADHATALTRGYFGADLAGVRVVYDAIHGSGRGVTDALLERLGATVVRRRCDRDPAFGGVAPEPSPEVLTGLSRAVRAHDADLGVANDGDADRIAVCTPGCGYIDGNQLYAVVYDALLGDAGRSGPAVRTVSTTFLIDRIARAHGTRVHEVPVGFKWVAAAMGEHDALIGGEESGGYSVRGHVPQKDGVLLAVLVSAVAAREPVDDRLDRITRAHGEIHAEKTSVACPEPLKQPVIEALADRIPETIDGVGVDQVITLDGFKLLLDDGSWVLVRPSGTEPKLRVYAEAPTPARLDPLLGAGRDLIETCLDAAGS